MCSRMWSKTLSLASKQLSQQQFGKSSCISSSLFRFRKTSSFRNRRCYSNSAAAPNKEYVIDDVNKDWENDVHPYKSISPWKSKEEFNNYLLTQIIHNDDGLIAFNKPFGVGVLSYSASNTKRKRDVESTTSHDNIHLRGIQTTNYTLEKSLPFLKNALKKPELTLVKSTERMTSGIAVFAENKEYAKKFQQSLQISKSISHLDPLYKYRIISTNTPFTNDRHFHECVGLSLKSGSNTTSDRNEPRIERDISKRSVRSWKIKLIKAWVATNVLKYGEHKTVLLEVKTTTIKWNFLRVYCADILLPILGDHLYSCRVKTILGVPAKIDPSLSPSGSTDQVLTPAVLQALDVRESIQVPPHMHLLSYTLHNFQGKGKHLTLTAPEPQHFKWSQNRLKLITD